MHPVFRIMLVMGILLATGGGLTGCDATVSEPKAGSNTTAPLAGTTFTVTPSLGLVRNADVIVRDSLNVQVGTGRTGANGQATFNVTGSGPYIVEVRGGGGAEYFDESLGNFVSFPNGRSIHALVPNGMTSIGVTGLTEVAHSLWNANGAPLTDANVNLANDAIKNSLAPALPSLVIRPNPLGATPTADSLTAGAADLYAAILGGLANLGAGETNPALAVIEQLARDVRDGTIDGHEGATNLAPPYHASTFYADFEAEIESRRDDWGKAAMRSTHFNLVALVEPNWSAGGSGGPDLSALTALAGTRTFRITERGGALVNASTQATVGSDFEFTVDGGGAITSPRLTEGFDPATAGTTFSDNHHTTDSSLELHHVDDKGTTDTLDDIEYRVRLYVEGPHVRRLRYEETTSCGSGCSASAYLVAEMSFTTILPLQLSISGTYKYTERWQTMVYPSSIEMLLMSLDAINETTIRDQITTSRPALMFLAVTLIDVAPTRKVFMVTFTDFDQDGNTIDYDLTWTYETRRY